MTLFFIERSKFSLEKVQVRLRSRNKMQPYSWKKEGKKLFKKVQVNSVKRTQKGVFIPE